MQTAIAGSPAWQITISGCTIRQVRPTSMEMLYLEYLGQSACLTIWGASLKVTAAAVRVIQEAALDQPACPIEAYSYDLHVIGAIQDSQQVAQMTLDDWQQAQEAEPVLGKIIKRLREGMLEQDWFKKTDSPKLNQYKREQNNLVIQKGILYRRARPRESEETLLQLVLPTAQREVALRNAMMRLVI